MAPLALDRYMDLLRSDGTALLEAARSDLDRRVPACPDWTERELLVHTGGVHRFWGDIAERRLADPSESRPEPAPDDDPGIAAWYQDGLEKLVDTLSRAAPHEPVWSWSTRKEIGFVQRRMPQETAVHRWDAQDAVGEADPIDGQLAVDGVDEWLEVFGPAQDVTPNGAGETIHLHRTDGEGEWLVRLQADGIEVTKGHEKGDAALRGNASDLLLALWRRIPLDRLEVLGDRAVTERFLGWQDLD
ncbi:MAG: maleylpyruvate isomerase family mycothiol-dependent enzyme [Actinomycetota bacterium]|nr:maleylpyruvate isomerase family mycothiol-dependent enzyme [Actinomycetota bacterium]